MAAYIVRTPLRHGGDEPTPPGETVELDPAEGDALVALGALEPAPDDATGASKPLARMNRAELTAAAEAAGVEITVGMTNKQVVAAIEAKAAAGAAG